MIRLALALAALTASWCYQAAPALADDKVPPPRTLSLTGIGEVRARPDTAMVRIGVMRRAATARAALTASNAAMAEIIDYLKTTGIEPKDIQTVNFTVNPVYLYDSNNQQPPKITGYDVSNDLHVTIRKLGDLGTALDDAVSKGSNQVHGVQFTIAEPRPLQDEARKLAIADASAKARLYAQAAGVALGPVLSISENLAQPPQPVYMKAERLANQADGSVPVAEGEQIIEMQVNITWEIK
ncbi:MAG: SIMPL domain-containing protein [Pseudomonadota bacterium]|nr:SIMPL domain-containing protein [Pseudomonadota bacterium]